MKKILLSLGLLGIGAGCVVVPARGPVVYGPPGPVVVVDAPPPLVPVFGFGYYGGWGYRGYHGYHGYRRGWR